MHAKNKQLEYKCVAQEKELERLKQKVHNLQLQVRNIKAFSVAEFSKVSLSDGGRLHVACDHCSPLCKAQRVGESVSGPGEVGS